MIELVIALALTGIIGTAATMSIHQIITGAALANNHNTAINQVRNAGYWISRDAQMAQIVNATPGDSKILELTWVEWEGTVHTVDYVLQGDKLRRDYDGQQTLIAQYIDPAKSSCHWDEVEKVLSVNITAEVSGKTEARTFQIKPRPD